MVQEIQGAGLLYNSAEAHTCTGPRGLGMTLPLSRANLKELIYTKSNMLQIWFMRKNVLLAN